MQNAKRFLSNSLGVAIDERSGGYECRVAIAAVVFRIDLSKNQAKPRREVPFSPHFFSRLTYFIHL